MRTIIAGSRNIKDYGLVESAIQAAPWNVTTVICGCAKGVDTVGAAWAGQNDVPVEFFPAQWATHGRSAGMIRNQQMARAAEALIAIWDGNSPGTGHMIETARQMNLAVHVHRVGAPQRRPQLELI